MHRLFVALRPPPPIRLALLDLMEGVTGARWQSDEQLHLTLAFIGEVERPVAEDVATALDRVDGPQAVVALGGVGLFGQSGRPNSVWLGCLSDPGLTRLHARIMRALALAGVRTDARAFHPHITLARLNRSSGPTDAFLARHAGIALPPFTADSFCLFESRLGREGASYEAAARYRLRADR